MVSTRLSHPLTHMLLSTTPIIQIAVATVDLSAFISHVISCKLSERVSLSIGSNHEDSATSQPQILLTGSIRGQSRCHSTYQVSRSSTAGDPSLHHSVLARVVSGLSHNLQPRSLHAPPIKNLISSEEDTSVCTSTVADFQTHVEKPCSTMAYRFTVDKSLSTLSRTNPVDEFPATTAARSTIP